MAGLGALESQPNIAAPADPTVSAQHMGGFGIAEPGNINQYGATPGALDQYSQALQGAVDSLKQRVAAPNWFNVAAGFLTPGPGGFFGELGQANRALAQFTEQRRQMALPIAQMQAQLAQSRIQMSQNQQAAQIVQGLQAQAPKGDLSQLPLGTLTQGYVALASLGPAGQNYAKALEGALHAARSKAGVATDVAHATTAGVHGETAAAGVGQPGVAGALQQRLGNLLGAQGASGPASPAALPAPAAAPAGGAAPATIGNPSYSAGAVSATPQGTFQTAPNASYGDIVAAYAAGHLTGPQTQQILTDMAHRGVIPMPQYQQMMKTIQLDENAGGPAASAPAPQGAQAPQGAPASAPEPQVPLDLSQVPPQQLPSLLQGATWTPASINTPRGYVPPQEASYNHDLQTISSIAGNSALLSTKTSQINTLLNNVSQDKNAAAAFNAVTGILAKDPGIVRALLSSVDPSMGAMGAHVKLDLQNFASKNIPAKYMPMFDQVVQAVAQNAALEAQMRGLPFGHGVTASQADVSTGGLPNMAMTPPALLQSFLQTVTNAQRLHTLYQAYSRLSPLLRQDSQGRLNLAPSTTFFTSPYAREVNNHFNNVINHYDSLTSGNPVPTREGTRPARNIGVKVSFPGAQP